MDKIFFWGIEPPCFPPVLHGLYRAGGVVEAGQLTARPDDVHQRRELVLVLPSRHQTWCIIMFYVGASSDYCEDFREVSLTYPVKIWCYLEVSVF